MSDPSNTKRRLIPLWRILCGVACALAHGCLSIHESLDTPELPAEWRNEIERPRKPPVDLSGTYLNRGQFAARQSVKSGKLWSRDLSREVFPFEKERLPAADEVQLVQHGQERLEFILLRNGEAVWTREMNIDVDRKTGVVALPTQSDSGVGGNLAAAAIAHKRVHLIKGDDGCLYAQLEESSFGAIGVVIPMSGAVGSWGRWNPVALEDLARQAKPKGK